MMMTAFDTPTPFTTVGRRNVSNVPGQMLFLMNDPFVHEQAGVWARNLLSQLPEASPEERIRHLFLSAFCREPSESEAARCIKTLRDLSSAGLAKEEARVSGLTPSVDSWTAVCHALFGVKEFIYVR
jgi:hypothetical protein